MPQFATKRHGGELGYSAREVWAALDVPQGFEEWFDEMRSELCLLEPWASITPTPEGDWLIGFHIAAAMAIATKSHFRIGVWQSLCGSIGVEMVGVRHQLLANLTFVRDQALGIQQAVSRGDVEPAVVAVAVEAMVNNLNELIALRTTESDG